MLISINLHHLMIRSITVWFYQISTDRTELCTPRTSFGRCGVSSQLSPTRRDMGSCRVMLPYVLSSLQFPVFFDEEEVRACRNGKGSSCCCMIPRERHRESWRAKIHVCRAPVSNTMPHICRRSVSTSFITGRKGRFEAVATVKVKKPSIGTRPDD
ncbi:hypothetical protein LIA77_04492 [Sarocladium implicatum]|nr:hypothetical protein LIA77_04492 [Sarocladium implicatum]